MIDLAARRSLEAGSRSPWAMALLASFGVHAGVFGFLMFDAARIPGRARLIEIPVDFVEVPAEVLPEILAAATTLETALPAEAMLEAMLEPMAEPAAEPLSLRTQAEPEAPLPPPETIEAAPGIAAAPAEPVPVAAPQKAKPSPAPPPQAALARLEKMRGAARQQAAEAHKYEPRRAPRPPGPEKPAPAARAAALPAPAASADVIGAWKSSVAARIAGNKSYPESARLRGAGGTAMVALAIGSGGQLASASVSRSSGQSDLDAAALSAVRRSAPFAPPPQGAPRAFAVPFRYGIN